MGVDSLSSALSSAASTSWHFLNSNLAIAVIGGFAGAIGGALGAQRIAERSRKREEGLRELRYTNAAIMIAHTICNAALALKKQHVQPMRESFLKAKADLETLKTKRNAGHIAADVDLRVQMDMVTFPAPIVPIETLKRISFQDLSMVGRPLALVAVIEQSLVGLTYSIEERDQFIKRFASGDIPENVQESYYFGLPLQGGHVNTNFPDLVEAIYGYVEDLAFFSSLLCSDLMKYGANVREALVKKYRKQVPYVSEADFSGVVKSGLIPPDAQYKDWLDAFVERLERAR